MKIVSFDIEGTLTTHRFSDLIWEEAIPRLYSEKVGISFEEAKSYVMREYLSIGEERVEWYDIKYWFSRFGLTNYEKLLNQHRHRISYHPEVMQVLDEMSKNYTLVVSSNSAREFIDLVLEKLKDYFRSIFSAPSDFKQTKKDGEFYLNVCDKLEIDPSEMIHVGDHWVFDFITPTAIGVKAFYLDRKGERKNKFIVKDLKEFSDVVKRLGM